MVAVLAVAEVESRNTHPRVQHLLQGGDIARDRAKGADDLGLELVNRDAVNRARVEQHVVDVVLGVRGLSTKRSVEGKSCISHPARDVGEEKTWRDPCLNRSRESTSRGVTQGFPHARGPTGSRHSCPHSCARGQQHGGRSHSTRAKGGNERPKPHATVAARRVRVNTIGEMRVAWSAAPDGAKRRDSSLSVFSSRSRAWGEARVRRHSHLGLGMSLHGLAIGHRGLGMSLGDVPVAICEDAVRSGGLVLTRR